MSISRPSVPSGHCESRARPKSANHWRPAPPRRIPADAMIYSARTARLGRRRWSRNLFGRPLVRMDLAGRACGLGSHRRGCSPAQIAVAYGKQSAVYRPLNGSSSVRPANPDELGAHAIHRRTCCWLTAPSSPHSRATENPAARGMRLVGAGFTGCSRLRHRRDRMIDIGPNADGRPRWPTAMIT